MYNLSLDFGILYLMHVTPNIYNLRVARHNAGYTTREATRFLFNGTKRDRVAEWECGKALPTFDQLEKLANEYQTSIFQLAKDKKLPRHRVLPDYGNLNGKRSKNLRKYINFLYQRQQYTAMVLKENGAKKVRFGKVANTTEHAVAEKIRQKLQYEYQPTTKANHLDYLIQQAEAVGIFVMKTLAYWPIEVEEMRGLYLKNEYAPFISLNRDDAKTAQLFTLAHEIAHAFINKEGISNVDFRSTRSDSDETFCNRVAAELLLPKARFTKKYYTLAEIEQIAKDYQLSESVVLYRLLDLGKIARTNRNRFTSKIEKRKLAAVQARKQKRRGKIHTLANMKEANGKLFMDFVSSLFFDGTLNGFEATKLLQMPIESV